jgi:uncharacterized SAM-binding protein YcdF (DUF218 family)
LGKDLRPPAAKRRYGKGIYFLNFILFIIPVTYFAYQPLLRSFAGIIMIDDPAEKSDAILVLSGGEPGRAWGAADLYNRRLGDYVMVTKERPENEESELLERGIEWVDSRGNYVRVLRGLGVPKEKIILVDPPVDSTLDELQRVRQVCLEHNWRSLIIVTANYHTRRTRMAARYAFGPEFRVAVVPSPHGGLNTNAWWKNHADVRTFLIEFEKLVAYTLYIGPRILARDIWTSRSDTSQSSISLASPNS